MTDANLVLGRLVPDYFPKIFGKSEKEPLDIEASRSAFDKLAQEINASVSEDKKMDLDEIVYGCVRYLRFILTPQRLIQVDAVAGSSRSPMRRCADRSVLSPKHEVMRRQNTCELYIHSQCSRYVLLTRYISA